MSKTRTPPLSEMTDPAFAELPEPLCAPQEKVSAEERRALSELVAPLFTVIADEAPVRVITIGRPKVETRGGRSRLLARIDVAGDVREVWFEVEEKYGHGLCCERSDAFLVALLNWAMRERCDFVCEAPVGEELLYQLREYLIPAVVKASRTLYAPKITAEIDAGTLPNAGAVGTGISCGVDSLHVVANQAESPFPHLRLTHLVLYNVGAFYHDDEDRQFHWHIDHARKFAKEYGLEFIETNSNLSEAFPQNHYYTNGYSNGFAILALQKFWRTYFLASDGCDFSEFNLIDNETKDSAHYDLLTTQCLSSRQMRIYPEGGAKTRFEKTRQLVDFVPAQKYLHVCTSDLGPNCNVCGKCRRTLVTLDALGALEKFRAVFDIDYYKSHRRAYLRWLAAQRILPHGDLMIKEPFEILRKDISPLLWAEALVFAAYSVARSRLAKIAPLRAFYRRFFKRAAR